MCCTVHPPHKEEEVQVRGLLRSVSPASGFLSVWWFCLPAGDDFQGVRLGCRWSIEYTRNASSPWSVWMLSLVRSPPFSSSSFVTSSPCRSLRIQTHSCLASEAFSTRSQPKCLSLAPSNSLSTSLYPSLCLSGFLVSFTVYAHPVYVVK